jgi:sirohydrochlorin cobaltochelatase
LIVGHGTRDDEGAADFRAFVRRVEARAAATGVAADAVAGGFIELSPPPLKDAVSALVAAGHVDLTAVPLILLAAGHAKGDIPAALARERDRHPGVRTRYARPLGPHPVVLELLRRRLEQALATTCGATSDATFEPTPEATSDATPTVTAAATATAAADAVLLVGRGTTDPDANADLYRAGRLLWETTQDLGMRQVEAAFVSLARPSVPEGLDRLRALGARRIVVLPFFLFRGVLPTRIHSQVGQWLAEQGGDDGGPAVTVAEVIGDCDELADLVLERYTEADGRGAAPAGMNCDACVYRIAMPGFEARVGREQRPHDHPDDPAAHGHDGHSHGHAHELDPAHGHAHEHAHGHPPAHTHEHAQENGHPHAPGHAHVHSVPETRISASATAPAPPMG